MDGCRLKNLVYPFDLEVLLDQFSDLIAATFEGGQIVPVPVPGSGPDEADPF